MALKKIQDFIANILSVGLLASLERQDYQEMTVSLFLSTFAVDGKREKQLFWITAAEQGPISEQVAPGNLFFNSIGKREKEQ